MSPIWHHAPACTFLADLKHTFKVSSFRLPSSALVLGSGGSARAIVYALLNNGWEITLVARRIEQARQLALLFPEYEIRTINYESLILQPSSFSLPSSFCLLVNTTPVGMTPNIDQSPWPENLAFPPHAAIYDLVYNPRETKLVRDACAQGRLATTGLGMLVAQAALSFEIWTGCKPPREVMFEALDQPAH